MLIEHLEEVKNVFARLMVYGPVEARKYAREHGLPQLHRLLWAVRLSPYYATVYDQASALACEMAEAANQAVAAKDWHKTPGGIQCCCSLEDRLFGVGCKDESEGFNG